MMLPNALDFFLPLDSPKLIPAWGPLDLLLPPCSSPCSAFHLAYLKHPVFRNAIPAMLANAAHPLQLIALLGCIFFQGIFHYLKSLYCLPGFFSVSPHSTDPVGCLTSIHFPFLHSEKKPVLFRRLPSLLWADLCPHLPQNSCVEVLIPNTFKDRVFKGVIQLK